MESPIEAYRAWHTGYLGAKGKVQDWALRSLAVHNTPWIGPVVRADVKPFDMEEYDKARMCEGDNTDPFNFRASSIAAFSRISRCGLYSLKTIEYTEVIARDYCASAWGEVDIWGRVVEHELGYRSEFMLVKKIYLIRDMFNSTELSQVVLDLGRRYDCDVIVE